MGAVGIGVVAVGVVVVGGGGVVVVGAGVVVAVGVDDVGVGAGGSTVGSVSVCWRPGGSVGVGVGVGVVVVAVVVVVVSGVLATGLESAWALSLDLLAMAFLASSDFFGCSSTTVLLKLCCWCVTGAGTGTGAGGVATTAG